MDGRRCQGPAAPGYNNPVVGTSASFLLWRLGSSGQIRLGTDRPASSAAERGTGADPGYVHAAAGSAPGSSPVRSGLVICLLGSMDGTLREKPIFWLNALSPALFLAWSLATFPTGIG